MAVQTFDEADCLSYDVFSDYEPEVRVISDKIVTTRTPHKCQHCCEDIDVGTRARARAEINTEEKKLMTFYFCQFCCYAMAIASGPDNGETMERRYLLGQEIEQDV